MNIEVHLLTKQLGSKRQFASTLIFKSTDRSRQGRWGWGVELAVHRNTLLTVRKFGVTLKL